MKPKRGSRSAGIDDIAECLQRGDLDGLPDRLDWDPDHASLAELNTFIEWIRLQSFGHLLLAPYKALGLAGLQPLRTLVATGGFYEAIQRIDETANSKDDPELCLEKARSLVFVGDYAGAAPILKRITANQRAEDCTRGVAWQVLGHVFFELRNQQDAQSCFEQAAELADHTGNLLGQAQSRIFLAKLAAYYASDFDRAWALTGEALGYLLRQGAFRWILGFFRHLSHLDFLAGSPSCLGESFVGISLSNALEDRLFVCKGWAELAIMKRGLTGESDTETLLELIELARDLPPEAELWRLGAEGDLPLNGPRFIPETLRQLIARPRRVEAVSEDFFFATTSRAPKPSWVYHARWGFFVDITAGKIFPLASKSTAAEILLEVARSPSGVSRPDLFEKVYGENWLSNESQQSWVRVSLHRMEKLSPSLLLEKSTDQVRFVNPGLVISKEWGCPNSI